MKEPSIEWLLEPRDPSIRLQALIDLLDRPTSDKDVVATRGRIRNYGPVKRIMEAQTRSGYWAPKETCYRPKWTSAVWSLVLLGEMGVSPNPEIKGECERFLDLHQTETGSFACPSRIEESGKRWDEPCLTGNMIRTLITFGYEEDPRVQKAISWLPKQQLEDGGWNCDFPERKVKHGSFMSTIEPLWAYSEIPRQKWTKRMKRTIGKGAEFLLMHHVYKSDNSHWKPTAPEFTTLHFPMYYFYDALHGLRVLTKLGYSDDSRIQDAIHLILSKRNPNGTWALEGDWHRGGQKDTTSAGGYVDLPKGGKKTIVDLEEIGKPSKWITLNCLRVLTQTGDVDISRKL